MNSGKVNKPENPLLNLAFNIIIPIFVLVKLGAQFTHNGPLIALLVALSFPIGYGIYDWVKRRKRNWLSLFGIISVIISGGLALIQAEGIWFAISEASLPLLMGLGVLISAFGKKPFIETMLCNDSLMNMHKIELCLQERNTQIQFRSLLKTSTLLFSCSLFLGSILNFFLARRIFIPLNEGLMAEERTQQLNDQLAQMRYMSTFVITIPLLIFGIFIMWHLIRGIQKSSGLQLEEIMKSQ